MFPPIASGKVIYAMDYRHCGRWCWGKDWRRNRCLHCEVGRGKPAAAGGTTVLLPPNVGELVRPSAIVTLRGASSPQALGASGVKMYSALASME